jgi:transposase
MKNTTNLLDEKAFEIIKEKKQEGKTYTQIARILTKMGYLSKHGGEISNGQVSNFMVEKGIRLKKVNRSAYKTNPTVKPIEDKTHTESFMLDVLTSKLNKNQKLKVLTALID